MESHDRSCIEGTQHIEEGANVICLILKNKMQTSVVQLLMIFAIMTVEKITTDPCLTARTLFESRMKRKREFEQVMRFPYSKKIWAQQGTRFSYFKSSYPL